MTKKTAALMLRLPPHIRESLVEASKDNDRSLNNEIILRLWRSLRDEFVLTPLDLPEELIMVGLTEDFLDFLTYDPSPQPRG